MKVVGINGSSRKDGNTAILIKTIFEKLHENGIETELIQLPDVTIAPVKCVRAESLGNPDVLNDSEGMANMRNIGENMAWLLKNLHAEQKKER